MVWISQSQIWLSEEEVYFTANYMFLPHKPVRVSPVCSKSRKNLGITNSLTFFLGIFFGAFCLCVFISSMFLMLRMISMWKLQLAKNYVTFLKHINLSSVAGFILCQCHIRILCSIYYTHISFYLYQKGIQITSIFTVTKIKK